MIESCDALESTSTFSISSFEGMTKPSLTIGWTQLGQEIIATPQRFLPLHVSNHRGL